MSRTKFSRRGPCPRTSNLSSTARFEPLESRRMLCGLHIEQPAEIRALSADELVQSGSSGRGANDADIVWTNRANTTSGGAGDSDGFGATFGTSAPLVRAVVDAVITSYERVIGSFNYGVPGGYGLSVSAAAPGTGFGGSAGLTGAFAGKPAQGNLIIDGGTNTPDPN